MTLRSVLALAFALLAAAPCPAQIHPVPVETGRAPLAPVISFGAAAATAVPFASALTAAPSSLSAFSAPALSVPTAVLPPAPFSPDPIVPSTALRLRSHPSVSPSAVHSPSAVAVSVPGESPVAIQEASAANAPVRAAATSPSFDADSFFDGRSPRAAADGPALPPSSPSRAPSLKPGRLVRLARAAGVGVPAAVAMGVVGRLAPHAALAVVHGLGQVSYWLANPFAFLFTMPQVHKMLSRRSGDISVGMIAIGLLAAALSTVNFAFDGKTLMMARNLAQALGFGVMLVLHHVYARAPGKPAPSKTRAIVETVAIGAAVTAVLFLAGPWLMAAVQGVALMSHLLVPIQVVSGFGFTYIMFAQLSKMRREKSAGDSSPAMMWAFLGTKTIWVWSLATMIGLTTASPWLVLPVSAAFVAVCWIAGRAALSRLLVEPWDFLPAKFGLQGHSLSHERLGDIASFVALSAVILLLSAGGYFAFIDVLGVPAAAASRFAMYLLYTVQSLLACLATMKSLRLQSHFQKTQTP